MDAQWWLGVIGLALLTNGWVCGLIASIMEAYAVAGWMFGACGLGVLLVFIAVWLESRPERSPR